MDIEARFQKISQKADISVADLDNFYFDIIDALSEDFKELNNRIKQLKDLCLKKAIDHSKYKYREVSASVKEQIKVSPLPKKKIRFKESPPPQPGKSVDIGKVICICKKEVPFLSLSLLKLNSENPTAKEQLKVLYSQSINEDWIHKTFRPDSIDEISNFQVSALDSSCSWIVLCLFHSSDFGVVPQLQQLLDDNDNFFILNLTDFERGEVEEHCWRKNRNALLNSTVSDKPSLLVHDLLNSEQECLIKSFFGSNTGFLVCSDLKGGLSGARVILVAPNTGPGDPRKHVIKICEKSKSKLKQEYENFQNLVAPFWIPDQYLTAEFKESSRFEAIRYPFASKDTMLPSNSFTKKYKASQTIEVLQTIIGGIFNHTLFSKWREHSRKRKVVLSQAFKQMLNVSDAEELLKYLLSPEYSSEVKLNQDQLSKLLSAEIEILECPNHGDLHSDNIQIQNESNSVFLIDFGWTGIYPAGLDYAALEASIRFKLLDFSVDPKILLPLDSDPLSKFDNLVTPGGQLKGEIDKAEKVCSVIRQTFLNDFAGKGETLENLKLQYLCCLLVLCLRQLKYQELNRRYILQILSQIIPVIHTHLIV